MKEIKIAYETGRVAIYSPYNPDFVKQIKKIDGAKWNGSCWMVDKEHLAKAQEIVKNVYGENVKVEPTEKIRIRFFEDVSKYFAFFNCDRYEIMGIPFFDCKKNKFFENIRFSGDLHFCCICDDNYVDPSGLVIEAGSLLQIEASKKEIDKIVKRFDEEGAEKVKITFNEEEI